MIGYYEIIAWNDEFPDGNKTYFGGAHAKGLLAYDKENDNGILLIHSTSRYPSINSTGNNRVNIEIHIPHSHRIFGQNFMCMSVSGKTLDEIAKGLLLAE